MTAPRLSRPVSRRWITWLRWLGTLASLALLVALLGRQDWSEITRSAARLSANNAILALALLVASQGFNAWRWWILLRAQAISMSYYESVRLAFAGLFASNFLPSTIGGDVIRLAGVLAVAADRVAGTASVVVDRAVSVFGMLFLLPVSAMIFLPELRAGGWPMVAGLVTGEGGAASFLSRSLRRWMDAFALWAKAPASLARALAASWGGVVCYVLAIWVTAQGLGMSVTVTQVAGVTGLTYLLTLIPVSINGYGIREAAMVALYAQLGAVAEQASALALISRLLMMAVTLPGAAALPGLLTLRPEA